MMKDKRYIVQNLNFAAPYPGNLMRSVWDLELRCKEKNIEFIYCFPEIAKHISWIEEMINCGHIVCFKPYKPSFKFWNNIIKVYKPVVIHTHFWNIRDLLAIRSATLLDNKMHLILHHHNTYFESKKRWKELLKRMVMYSDIHIACGDAVGDGLIRVGFKNVVTVENAIDFSRLDDYAFLDRNDFDISDDAIVFLMFGFPTRRKGVDIAIKALNDLYKEKELVLCIVVASDLDKVKQNLKDEFGELPTWVKFLPPRDDIATYYRFADVFLSPSREEGFCYALPESVYSGAKLVFSNISGQMHALGIPNAIHFENENVESLQDQIKAVIDKEKTNTAQEYLCNRYNLSKWSESIVDVYVKCLN